jgi:outer membrane protein OmpA-like peptidoglycan-associated protein
MTIRNTLLSAAAALALAAPAMAMSNKDKMVVDQYRDKIAAARAEPGVQRFGAEALDRAAANIPALADALDHHKTRQVAGITGEIDTQLQIARTRAHTASSNRDAVAIAAAKNDAADARDAAASASAAAADHAADADAARAAAGAAQADAQAARADADKLRTAMADYQLKQTQLGATLVLQDVVFETGKADLKPGAAERLRPLASYLQANGNVRVQIDGHTDAQGSDSFNQQLSEARAGAVRAALGSMGVDGSRIVAIGHGKSEPVADNTTQAGRQQNRRVEVTLVGQPASQFAAGG